MIAGAKGLYSEKEVPDGEYSIEAFYPGFISVRLSPIRVFFPRHSNATFNFRLLKLTKEGSIQRQRFQVNLSERLAAYRALLFAYSKEDYERVRRPTGLVNTF